MTTKPQRLQVSRDLILEFYESDACIEFLKFSEYDISDDMAEAAIQDVAEDVHRAVDAIEALYSDMSYKENALTLLHAQADAAQALVRRYFVRANAQHIAAQIETNYLRDREIARIDAAEYAADSAAESAEARYARHAA